VCCGLIVNILSKYYFTLLQVDFVVYGLSQEAQITLECSVPRKYHGNIMGPKGHRIQEISKTHNVTIKIPDRNTEGTAFVQYLICGVVFFVIIMVDWP